MDEQRLEGIKRRLEIQGRSTVSRDLLIYQDIPALIEALEESRRENAKLLEAIAALKVTRTDDDFAMELWEHKYGSIHQST